MRNPEDALLDSWQHNAQAWIDAVRSGSIESRRQVTDQAILLAILGRQPERVLDLGCGEGWLLRALGDRGVEAVVWTVTGRWWMPRVLRVPPRCTWPAMHS